MKRIYDYRRDELVGLTKEELIKIIESELDDAFTEKIETETGITITLYFDTNYEPFTYEKIIKLNFTGFISNTELINFDISKEEFDNFSINIDPKQNGISLQLISKKDIEYLLGRITIEELKLESKYKK